MGEQYTIGAIILYLLIEVIKFFITKATNGRPYHVELKPRLNRQIDDLWNWHNVTDSEGRKLWYVPSHIHVEQEKMVEMLRQISANQETTARVLGDLVKKLEAK